jgi:hypothetical protein
MRSPPLIVDRSLLQVRRIEAMPEVASVNMRIPDMWSRLWANGFLLKKTQYFEVHSYEGRLNTPLRGEWDLDGGLVQFDLPGGDSVRINAQYSLERVGSPYHLSAEAGNGWYPLERKARGAWQWSAGSASIRFENPHDRSRRVAPRLDVRSLDSRDFEVWVAGKRLLTTGVGASRASVDLPPFDLPPGSTRMELRTSTPPVLAPGGQRLLAFAVYGVEARVLADAPERGPDR